LTGASKTFTPPEVGHQDWPDFSPVHRLKTPATNDETLISQNNQNIAQRRVSNGSLATAKQQIVQIEKVHGAAKYWLIESVH
jgi:hypothetical protein